MKILVCDDAEVMRNIYFSVLVENGIPADDILLASDGNEALKAMDGNQVKLFLIDWNMPNLNGFDLVKKIRSMREYEDTPVVMVTAESGRYNIMDAIEAGVTNYVMKPIKADLLWAKIKPYLE